MQLQVSLTIDPVKAQRLVEFRLRRDRTQIACAKKNNALLYKNAKTRHRRLLTVVVDPFHRERLAFLEVAHFKSDPIVKLSNLDELVQVENVVFSAIVNRIILTFYSKVLLSLTDRMRLSLSLDSPSARTSLS